MPTPSEPLKPLLRLLIPLLVIFVSAVLLMREQWTDIIDPALISLTPYPIFAITLMLAHFFNRSRYFYTALMLAVIYWLIQQHLQTSLTEPAALSLYSAISIMAPLALLSFTVLPERGLWNIYGTAALLLPLVLAALGYWIFHTPLPENPVLALATFTLKPYQGYVLSMTASFLFLMTLIIGIGLLKRRNTEAEASLLTCQLCLFFTLAFFHQTLISVLMFCAAGVVLIIGLLRSSFEMAYRDDLTGLLSRRALNEKLKGLGRGYSIAMLDIDHFKQFNDTHGHDVGDDVLKIVAQHIGQVSGGGVAYRYGGEEFCIIFPGKALKKCIRPIDNVREDIEDYKIALRDRKNRPKSRKEGMLKRKRKSQQKKVSVTISIGLAEHSETVNRPELVLKTADKALYKAKHKGRNCVVY
jgi:diguanylate cyclase (GGDEF)-like protein